MLKNVSVTASTIEANTIGDIIKEWEEYAWFTYDN